MLMIYAIDECINITLKNEKVLKYSIISNAIKSVQVSAKILEIGCGGGTIVRTLAKEFPQHTFVGFDTDTIAISHANNNIIPNLSFINSLSNINNFDIVFLIDVLEHCEEPDIILTAIKNTLKPTGLIIIHTPLEKSGIYSIKKCRDIKSLNSDHKIFYNYDDVAKLLQNNDIIITKKYFHYHFISGFRDFLKYYLFSHTPQISKDKIYTQYWRKNMKLHLIFDMLDWLAYYETKILNSCKTFSSGATIFAKLV
jgi:SAM-dependent methyltransferase